MNYQTPITVADLQTAIQELIPFIDGLLISVGFSTAILGIMVGWYLRGRYETWYWVKHGQPLDDGETQ